MTADFPTAAHAALRDTQLRQNLAVATQTIREKRARVVDERPDWQALRDQLQAGDVQLAEEQEAIAVLAEQAPDLRSRVLRHQEAAVVHWTTMGFRLSRR